MSIFERAAALRRLGAVLLVLAMAWAGPMARAEDQPEPLEPGEEPAKPLTEKGVGELVPQLLRFHLRRPTMDAPFLKRAVQNFFERLDRTNTIYLKDEADERLKLNDEQLGDLGKQILAGDLRYFKTWVREYQTKQLARDDDFYKNLESRREEITKEVEERLKAEKESGKDKVVPDEAEELAVDKDDKIDWKAHPATDEERHKRMLLLVKRSYAYNREYLNEDDSFKQALQAFRRARQEWLEFEVDKKTPEVVMKTIMNSMDPHSEYMDSDDIDEFDSSMARSFAGIGVRIRSCPSGAQVEEVIKGGPAAKSKRVDSGDQIIAVGKTVLEGMSLSKIVKFIRGEKDSEVQLTLRKANRQAGGAATEVVTLVRDEIDLTELRVTGKKFDTAQGPVGVISVQNFYKGVSGDVEKRIRELGDERPLEGLVLDLRNNSGGLLREAVRLAGLFISEGPVVAERDSDGVSEWIDDTDDRTVFDKPLVVLVNQFSASASEIVAGALQDYGRAVIVGHSQTHGKGTVQQVLDLTPYRIGGFRVMGQVKITKGQYFIAGGKSVQRIGIVPDVLIPGYRLFEEGLERSYENALDAAEIASKLKPDNADVARYMSFKTASLEKLRTLSGPRVAANKDFDIFRMDEKLEGLDKEVEKLEGEKAKLAEGDAAKKAELEKKVAELQSESKTLRKGIAEKRKTMEEQLKALGKVPDEDKPDVQRDEAVQIVADAVGLWRMRDGVAKADPPAKNPAVDPKNQPKHATEDPVETK